MPGVAARVCSSAVALAALPITSTGSPAPAGKCCASTVSAVIDWGCPRNDWAVVSVPTLKPMRPREARARSSAVTTHTRRGCRAIIRPTRAQTPCAVGSSVPNRGRTGQNTHRPQITSRAGSSVIMASRPRKMPIAATGPSPEMSADSATSRHSIPAITVAALAMIAGPARRSAIAMASAVKLYLD
jgi:hypothetical protein